MKCPKPVSSPEWSNWPSRPVQVESRTFRYASPPSAWMASARICLAFAALCSGIRNWSSWADALEGAMVHAVASTTAAVIATLLIRTKSNLHWHWLTCACAQNQHLLFHDFAQIILTRFDADSMLLGLLLHRVSPRRSRCNWPFATAPRELSALPLLSQGCQTALAPADPIPSYALGATEHPPPSYRHPFLRQPRPPHRAPAP